MISQSYSKQQLAKRSVAGDRSTQFTFLKLGPYDNQKRRNIGQFSSHIDVMVEKRSIDCINESFIDLDRRSWNNHLLSYRRDLHSQTPLHQITMLSQV